MASVLIPPEETTQRNGASDTEFWRRYQWRPVLRNRKNRERDHKRNGDDDRCVLLHRIDRERRRRRREGGAVVSKHESGTGPGVEEGVSKHTGKVRNENMIAHRCKLTKTNTPCATNMNACVFINLR